MEAIETVSFLTDEYVPMLLLGNIWCHQTGIRILETRD
jgi:hypothetical protein